jgi:hypothetical protein
MKVSVAENIGTPNTTDMAKAFNTARFNTSLSSGVRISRNLFKKGFSISRIIRMRR